MGNQNPYENYSPNPEWQNNQPPYPGPVPPTQDGPDYAPQSYPATKYNQPGAYPPPYEQPAAYAPPPQYNRAPAYPHPPPIYQQPQGYAPQNAYAPYAVPVTPPDRNGGFAIAGLILGIISIFAAILPICGFPVSIVGIVMSSLGRRSVSKRTMAVVGLVLAIIGIILAIASAAYGASHSIYYYQQ